MCPISRFQKRNDRQHSQYYQMCYESEKGQLLALFHIRGFNVSIQILIEILKNLSVKSHLPKNKSITVPITSYYFIYYLLPCNVTKMRN